jgi:HEAT repeat protein
LRIEIPQVELILADLLQDNEPDVREEAAEAMRLLRTERAVRWLEHRLRDETNAEVRQTIQRELTRHQSGRS